MKPFSVRIWVYADSEQQAAALQEEIDKFVMDKYNQGVYIKADTLRSVLQRYGGNAIVNAFLK